MASVTFYCCSLPSSLKDVKQEYYGFGEWWIINTHTVFAKDKVEKAHQAPANLALAKTKFTLTIESSNVIEAGQSNTSKTIWLKKEGGS